MGAGVRGGFQILMFISRTTFFFLGGGIPHRHLQALALLKFQFLFFIFAHLIGRLCYGSGSIDRIQRKQLTPE